MLIVGLTGSIGMGKSTSRRCSREPRHCRVRRRCRGAPALRGRRPCRSSRPAFPGTTRTARSIARQLAAGAARQTRRTSSAWRPSCIRWCRGRARRFFATKPNAGAPIAVLEIPLLFETGRDAQVDRDLVVSAPAEVQRARVLARPGMTAEKLDQMLARQMPDARKAPRADFVVDTGRTPCRDARPKSMISSHNCLRDDGPTAFDALLALSVPVVRVRSQINGNAARNRARHGNDWPRSPQGRSADRNRLRRAGEPHPDRARVSPLHQSRARRPGRGGQAVHGISDRVPARQAALLGRRR